ncbi:MAG: hypothetical protein R3E12_07435 [Candidatus Eisenbacteria bacterium]
MRKAITRALVLTAVVLVAAGCAERKRIEPTNPTDAAGFVARGWNFFANGNFDDALADFASAIALDADFADAYVGQGWARLGRSTDSAGMLSAVQAFDDANVHGANGADVDAGRAAARLGAGGSNLSLADTAAQAALQKDASFVFAHQSSFDRRDLLLIEAFARAGQGSLSSALTAAEQIRDSGIEASNPGTWVVNGVTFPTFEAATLAFLHQLSEEFSG